MGIIRDASAKFIHLAIWKCHISPPKMKLKNADKLERNDLMYSGHEKIIYIDIGYKSANEWRKDIKDKEATLIKTLLLWIKSFSKNLNQILMVVCYCH